MTSNNTKELAAFSGLPDEAHVRVETVAALYAVSPASVWRWSKLGMIPKPRKLGPQVTRWNVGELRANLKRGREKRQEQKRVLGGKIARWNRKLDMLARHEAGETYAAIAQHYGISPSRVRQIVAQTERRVARGYSVSASDDRQKISRRHRVPTGGQFFSAQTLVSKRVAISLRELEYMIDEEGFPCGFDVGQPVKHRLWSATDVEAWQAHRAKP